ncbi:hypothetical protein EON79_07200 [bacterium]|nr:MAG: hypothetical protein EON79_07200 [bacterium]
MKNYLRTLVIPSLALAGMATAQTTPPELKFEVDRPEIGKPIFEETFEGGLRGHSAYAVEAFERWQVTEGTVNILRSPKQGIGGYLDLGGYTRNPGTFQTRLPLLFLPDTRYEVSFDSFSPNGKSNTAILEIGSRSLRIETHSKSPKRVTGTFTFAEATQARILFRGLGQNNVGVGIDNIRITPVH